MKTQIYYNVTMQKKSSNLAALWFIPLVAVLLAAMCTLGFMIFTHLYKGIKKPAALAVRSLQKESVPVVPVPPVQPEPVAPPQVQPPTPAQPVPAQAEEICPATTQVPTKIKKSPQKRRRRPAPMATPAAPQSLFEQGLRACLEDSIFPCGWEDSAQGVIKQYWLMGPQGPIQRGIYDMGGNLISETIATLNGTVTSYTEHNNTYYFEGGVLVKIRTTPYENCNFHDWFFIDPAGRLDVCQCVYSTQNCCARSPYRPGTPRAYCDMHPLDSDFCK